jgi:hypothetical protein
MAEVKNEISDYNKKLQEVGTRVKKSAFPSLRSKKIIRPRAMTTDTIDDAPHANGADHTNNNILLSKEVTI